MITGRETQRIGVVVVAYNAASTLAQVLDRIPEGLRERLDSVLVCDDHSQDDTYEVALALPRGNARTDRSWSSAEV